MKRIALLFALAAPATLSAQAARTAPAAAGEWSGTLETPGAAVPLRLVLRVKGDTLTGTAKRSSGDVPLSGRVKGDSLLFSYVIDYGGSPFTMNLRGRVKGDSLVGVVDFGESGTAPFVTTRVKTP